MFLKRGPVAQRLEQRTHKTGMTVALLRYCVSIARMIPTIMTIFFSAIM